MSPELLSRNWPQFSLLGTRIREETKFAIDFGVEPEGILGKAEKLVLVSLRNALF